MPDDVPPPPDHAPVRPADGPPSPPPSSPPPRTPYGGITPPPPVEPPSPDIERAPRPAQRTPYGGVTDPPPGAPPRPDIEPREPREPSEPRPAERTPYGGLTPPPPIAPPRPEPRPEPDVTLPAARRQALAAVAPQALCVTSGALATRRVDVPTFRAVALERGGDAAAMRIVVNGRTEKTRALASGQRRRQIGLKLRAGDGCNLVYVMWRLDPKPALEVSVKSNPGARTAKECGARGYTRIKPAARAPLPALDDGAEHELRAAIEGDTLVATIDGREVWRGRLPEVARRLSGPAGLRSDNLAFELVDFEAPATTASASAAAKCKDAVGD